jgi:hypothetical protein
VYQNNGRTLIDIITCARPEVSSGILPMVLPGSLLLSFLHDSGQKDPDNIVEFYSTS